MLVSGMAHFFFSPLLAALMTSNTKDYYLILQVQPSAEPEVIQAAYRTLARKYHPDVEDNNPVQMQELNEAYEVLSSPDKRAAYDRWYRSRQWWAAALNITATATDLVLPFSRNPILSFPGARSFSP